MSDNLEKDIQLLRSASFDARQILDEIHPVGWRENPEEYYDLQAEDDVANEFMEAIAEDIEDTCIQLEKVFDKLSIIINRLEYLNR